HIGNSYKLHGFNNPESLEFSRNYDEHCNEFCRVINSKACMLRFPETSGSLPIIQGCTENVRDYAESIKAHDHFNKNTKKLGELFNFSQSSRLMKLPTQSVGIVFDLENGISNIRYVTASTKNTINMV